MSTSPHEPRELTMKPDRIGSPCDMDHHLALVDVDLNPLRDLHHLLRIPWISQTHCCLRGVRIESNVWRMMWFARLLQRYIRLAKARVQRSGSAFAVPLSSGRSYPAVRMHYFPRTLSFPVDNDPAPLPKLKLTEDLWSHLSWQKGLPRFLGTRMWAVLVHLIKGPPGSLSSTGREAPPWSSKESSVCETMALCWTLLLRYVRLDQDRITV